MTSGAPSGDAAETATGHAATPERRRALVAPLALASAGVAGLALLRLVDVTAMPIGLPCPFLAITGLWCPFCGGTRALDALASGDLGTAVSMNVLVVLLVPLVVVEWGRWTAGRARGRPTSFMNYSSRVIAVAAGVAVLFAVVRNIPGMEALTPALGIG